MAKEIINTKHITKVFNPGVNEVRAVNDVDIAINEGEFISLMGHSGSGKSTFLNILGCLDTPTSGSYFLDGRQVSNIPKDEISKIRNRKFGFIFQSYNLLPKTTCLENVELPLLYNTSVSKAERHERAKEALVKVGLEHRITHKTNELSGGQQQRVAIARALVNNPLVIFADEATGNLDTKTSYQIMELLQNLNNQNKTIIMVTHEDDIAAFSKRKVIMKDGKIIEDFLIDNPNNAAQMYQDLITNTTK